MGLIKRTFAQIFLISSLLLLVKCTTSTNDFNPLTSTFKFWSPISDLPSNSQIAPAYINLDREIDLVVTRNGALEWYSNLRGLGGDIHSFAISDKKADQFFIVNYQKEDSHDVVFLDGAKKKLIIALNPFRGEKPAPSTFTMTWEEKVIFDLGQPFEFDFENRDRYYVTSALKIAFKGSTDEDFLLILQDTLGELPTKILLVQRATNSKDYKIFKIHTFEQPDNVRLIGYQDLDGEGNSDIVIVMNKKLTGLLYRDDSGFSVLKTISDFIFNDDYRFNHVYFTRVYSTAGKDLVLIHPTSRKIGILLNTWDSKAASFPNWEFVELIRYQLKTRGDIDPGVNDFLIYKPAEHPEDFDYICVTQNEIRYFIRDPETKNVTVRGRTTFEVEMNIFHDIPLNLMVWNETVVNNQIFYVEENNISALVLFSASEGKVGWVEKNKIELDSVGWETNFWIYIMTYCLFMSILAGIIHGVMQNQLSFYRPDEGLLPEKGVFGADIQMGEHPAGTNRRTTV